jgi:hypothetical protein
LVARLPEEAAALARVAPQVLGRETLEQRAVKPPPRFRFRIGKSATQQSEPEWQRRTLVSEYAFTTYSSDGGLHEVHQVISVDGHPVKNAGPDALMRIILATGDDRKRELLEQFAGHGLRGAVTDFGQLLLLFTPANIVRYEFVYRRSSELNGTPALVFQYRQIDGPDSFTVIEAEPGDAGRGRTRSVRATGEIWARASDYLPLRVTLTSETNASEANMPGKDSENEAVREEAAVDYEMSPFGALLPIRTEHREFRGGRLVMENLFTYSDFRRFGATAQIMFEAEKE